MIRIASSQSVDNCLAAATAEKKISRWRLREKIL